MHRVFLTPSESKSLQEWLREHQPKAEFAIAKDETPVSNVSLKRFVRCPEVFKWPLHEDEEAFPIKFGTAVKKWLLEQGAGRVEEPKIQVKSKGKPAAAKLWVLRKDKGSLERMKKDFAAFLPDMPWVEGVLKLPDTHEAFLTFVPKPQSAHLQKARSLLKRPHEYRVFFRRNETKGAHDMVLIRTDLDADIYEYTLGEVLAELKNGRSQETPIDDKKFSDILRRVNSEDLDEFSGTLHDVPKNLKTPTKRIRWICKKTEGLSEFIEFLKKKETQLQKRTEQDLPERRSLKEAPRETENERESRPDEASATPDWNIDVLRKVFCEEQGVSAKSLDIIDELKALEDADLKVAKGAKKTYTDLISKGVTKEKMGSKKTSLISKDVTKEKTGSKGDIKAAMKDDKLPSLRAIKAAMKDSKLSVDHPPPSLRAIEAAMIDSKFSVDRPPPSLREICRDDDALTKHVQDVFQILKDSGGSADTSPPGEERLQEKKARSLRDEFNTRARLHVEGVVAQYDLFRVLSAPELKTLHLSTKQNLASDLGLLDSMQLHNILVKMNRDEDDYALGFDENDIPGDAMEESTQRKTSPSFHVGVPFQTPLPEPKPPPMSPASAPPDDKDEELYELMEEYYRDDPTFR